MKTMNPKGGLDEVMTPPELAERIMCHFRPSGKMLEPCRGDDAFYRWMPGSDWCEISKGRDFLSSEWVYPMYNWIVTNPPYSKFRAFLLKSMEVADNIVFLCPLNHLTTRARMRDIKTAGFGIAEILQVEQPPKPWPATGFALGACWLRRGWTGSTHIH
jgi:hypothetical protein